MVAPAIIRATSRRRSSSRLEQRRPRVCVRPAATRFSTRWCRSAKAATCGRCVTQMTWRPRDTSESTRPIASATAPPMPASTSSKT